ncbi:S1C family serine protease [Solobacterium moorei]
MSDQLNENNNEINKAIEAETIEKESQPVEESSIEATIKEETKETEKNKQTEESKKTVEANIKTGKKCPVKSKIFTTIGKAALAVICGFGGAWLYTSQSGNNGRTVVYQAEESGGSKTTSVSNEKNGTGLTVSQAAAKAAPSTVEIQTEVNSQSYGMFGGTYTTKAAGSGVIISKDGYIITNNHVISGAQKITVKTHDGTEYDAKLVGTDPKSDIAVLKVEANNLTPATLGDSSKISVGDTAIAIGNPLGTLGGTVTDGIISATSRELVVNNESMKLIQTNATINSGNSGGGLFDGNGNLIGIVQSKDSGTSSSGATIEGLGFAIPINDAMEVAEQLIKNGKVTDRATLGVYLQTLTTQQGNYTPGVYVTNVIDGSGAQAAGLKPYDKIVGADGKEVSSYPDLSAILKTKKPGDTIDLTIERDGKQIQTTITLTGTLDTKNATQTEENSQQTLPNEDNQNNQEKQIIPNR